MSKWCSWLLSGLLVATGLQVRADEGMWLLPYLQKLNIKEMKAKGLKLSADHIYNLNGNSERLFRRMVWSLPITIADMDRFNV